MVKDTDAMQKALTDISDVDDLIATFLPKMKAYLTVTLKAPWALQEAFGWYRNDAHRAECDRAKQNAKRLDQLAAAELANITTEEYIDRRSSILPVTPPRRVGDDEEAGPAPATPVAAGKVTTLPSDVFSFSKIQRAIYIQCTLATEKYMPGLLGDINVALPNYGVEALRMLFDFIAPRDDISKSSARSKFEAYFAGPLQGKTLHAFFEGALQQSKVVCYYEESEHDSHAIVDRTITALYGLHSDVVLVTR